MTTFDIIAITFSLTCAIIGICVSVWFLVKARLTPKSATGEFLDELLNADKIGKLKHKEHGIVSGIDTTGLSKNDAKDFEVGVYYYPQEKGRVCTSCIYGDTWQIGDTFIVRGQDMFCGAGYNNGFINLVSMFKNGEQHINWNLTDKDGKQVDCCRYKKRG